LNTLLRIKVILFLGRVIPAQLEDFTHSSITAVNLGLPTPPLAPVPSQGLYTIVFTFILGSSVSPVRCV